jgi:cell division protein FtsW (lipid II flippase)
MFPTAAVLASIGLVELYRIKESYAIKQAGWFALGLVFFCATIVLLRDYRVLERYRYTIAAASIGLLLLPRIAGQATNGAYLSIHVGSFSFQPAEFAKIGVVIFLASYLRDVREVLVKGRLPHVSLKHMGPLLVIWGASMIMLIFIRDLGSSLMFFGGFLALLYVATGRLSLVGAGAGLFSLGAWFLANHIQHVHSRVEIWQNPFRPDLFDVQGYQIAQGLFAMADGGLMGKGFNQSLLYLPGGQSILPVPHTDMIYAVITNELGLFGAAGLVIAYLLFVRRGFKAAMISGDGFGKLLATGLTAVFALQVFVIVGGVTKVIPLTGVTLPFISYGGSSIIANFVLLALLLIVSDAARSRRELTGGVVA